MKFKLMTAQQINECAPPVIGSNIPEDLDRLQIGIIDSLNYWTELKHKPSKADEKYSDSIIDANIGYFNRYLEAVNQKIKACTP